MNRSGGWGRGWWGTGTLCYCLKLLLCEFKTFLNLLKNALFHFCSRLRCNHGRPRHELAGKEPWVLPRHWLFPGPSLSPGAHVLFSGSHLPTQTGSEGMEDVGDPAGGKRVRTECEVERKLLSGWPDRGRWPSCVGVRWSAWRPLLRVQQLRRCRTLGLRATWGVCEDGLQHDSAGLGAPTCPWTLSALRIWRPPA